MSEGGQAGHGRECVQQVTFVCVVVSERPRGLDPQDLKTENGGGRFVGVERRLRGEEVHFSCPFKGIALGPEISSELRPVSRAEQTASWSLKDVLGYTTWDV